MKKFMLWFSGIAITVITGIMDFVFFPRIERDTEGIKAFDMNSFGYKYEQAQKFLDLIDDEGREIYLKKQLPLDTVYPVLYTTFFELAFEKLQGKKKPLIALPLMLYVFDNLENICSVKMLKDRKTTPKLAKFASTMTLCKSLTMYTIFGLLGWFFYKYRKEK
ncbi:MAG: hypothetical protein II473_04720 [Clostridia bacterium]|nr:hypothetical protein [Clostridia bacterium]MBQ1895931.1 hypothetical protein [Clostridia bacterium]MBQ2092465.1 hypothetical protein [Clostridia bacterium]MBQ2500784.1 hypothetical protein [Clostridia bacterium]MBQ3897619.1 hypothetical protein [Clostridia bacterium]